MILNPFSLIHALQLWKYGKTGKRLRACLKSTVCRVRTAHQPLKAPAGIKRVDNEYDRDPTGM